MRRPAPVLVAIIVVAAAASALEVGARIVHGRPHRDAGVDGLRLAIADIETGGRTTPLVSDPTPDGDVTVTFLARREGGQAPRIVSDVTGWGEHLDGTFDFGAGTMSRVGDTEWFSLRATVAARARIEYRIAYGLTDYRFDPHNPRHSAGPAFGGAPASEFVTNGYEPPVEFDHPAPGPGGDVREAPIDGPCRVEVYTPAGIRRDGEGALPAAVFLDARSAPAARVLDWLIARREIPPVVAAFVGQRTRGGDECAGATLGALVTGRLLEWLVTHRGVSPRAADRAVIAISYGAKDAVDFAFDHPDAFRSVGLLIPGRRITRTDLDAIPTRTGRPLSVFILAGRYDRSNLPTAQALRLALAAAGHRVQYVEVPEGHSAVTWRNHIRPVLVGLFGLAAEAIPWAGVATAR